MRTRRAVSIISIGFTVGFVRGAWLLIKAPPPKTAPDRTWDYETPHAPEPGPGVDIGPDFSMAMLHTRGDYACERVAFYLRPASPSWQSENARLPSGKAPPKNSGMRCGSCGRHVMLSELELRPRRNP